MHDCTVMCSCSTTTSSFAVLMLCLQDPETGLPQHRKEKLLQVFKVIDQVRLPLLVCPCLYAHAHHCMPPSVRCTALTHHCNYMPPSCALHCADPPLQCTARGNAVLQPVSICSRLTVKVGSMLLLCCL